MIWRRSKRFTNLTSVVIFILVILVTYMWINDYLTNLVSFAVNYNEKPTKKKPENLESIEPSYDVIYIAGRKPKRYFTTVVTTLFHFERSKHPDKNYEMWSETLLASISVPLIAYVDTYWADKFIQKCNKYNVTGIVFVAKSIWSLMRDLELERNKQYIRLYKEKQLILDPEKNIHSPELYAIWNLKHFLVTKVTNLNPYNSNIFIYTDSGAWRTRVFKNWPNQMFIRNLKRNLKNRILYGLIKEPEMSNYSPSQDLIEGGFFAGTLPAIQKASENFYKLHDEWLDAGRFIGKDQLMMNELVFVRKKSDYVRLRTFNLNCTTGYDNWFFYQYFLAQSDDFICSEKKISLLSSDDNGGNDGES